MDNYQIINKIKGGLIVSCQALEDEPLYSSFIMSKMALDIAEIQKSTTLPIIGLIKKDYADSEVYITPTEAEVDALVLVGADIIAMDATNRPRPNGESLDAFFKKIKKKYPNKLFMADCSTFDEGIHASELGFDIVSTTLSGYTKETKGRLLPDFDMLKKLVDSLDTPVIAEGGIWEPAQLKQAFDLGCHSAVVGSAITRPRDITRHFIAAIKEN